MCLNRTFTTWIPRLTAEMARKHKDVVVGIKSAHYQGPEWVSVERAVEAGTIANIPVMVDFGYFLAGASFLSAGH